MASQVVTWVNAPPLDTGDPEDCVLDDLIEKFRDKVQRLGWNAQEYQGGARVLFQRHSELEARHARSRNALLMSAFRIGDYIMLGEAATGEKVYSILIREMEALGDDREEQYKYKTLRNFRWLANAYPKEERVFPVNQSVYMALAAVQPREYRARLLSAAVEEGWTKEMAQDVANETNGNVTPAVAQQVGVGQPSNVKVTPRPAGGTSRPPSDLAKLNARLQKLEYLRDKLYQWGDESIVTLIRKLVPYIGEDAADALYVELVDQGRALLEENP